MVKHEGTVAPGNKPRDSEDVSQTPKMEYSIIRVSPDFGCLSRNPSSKVGTRTHYPSFEEVAFFTDTFCMLRNDSSQMCMKYRQPSGAEAVEQFILSCLSCYCLILDYQVRGSLQKISLNFFWTGSRTSASIDRRTLSNMIEICG